MTKRRTPPVSVGTATASSTVIPAASATAPLSEEKAPEEKAAIAAAVQAPPGAAEPFAAIAPADIAKNIVAADVAADLGTDAEVLGGPIDRAPLMAQDAAAVFEPGLRPIEGDVATGAAAVLGQGLRVEEDAVASLAGRAAPVAPLPGGAFAGALTDDLRADEGIGLDLTGRTIMVRSTSDRGRRRAGISFGPVPVPVEVDTLTEEELGGLLADPQLVVAHGN